MDERTAIEMLWEQADPSDALQTRFGFRDAPAAHAWVAELLGRCWDLDVARAHRLVISDRNVMAWVEAGGRPLIVKWSSRPDRFDSLQEAARVVAWLDAQGVPVAAPLPATDGRLLVEVGDGRHGAHTRAGHRFLVGVLPVVEGDLLDVDDPGQVADAGRMLATLHQALAAVPEAVSPGERPAGTQLVHHDFRSANLLHDGTRITAVLDFEELTRTTRVADLARSAVLLATRYRDWGPTTEHVRAAYVEAYEHQAQEPLGADERRDLDTHIAGLLKTFGWA